MNVRLRTTLFLMTVCATPLYCGGEVIYETTFSDGADSWTSYHRQAPNAAIEVAAGAGRDQTGLLRVKCPGKNSLEGAGVTVAVRPWSLYEVSVTMRGQGEAWLCLNSANGWLYARSTQALSTSWDTLTMQKLTGAKDTRMSLFVMTKSAHAAQFEIDAVTVARMPDPATHDAPALDLRLEAEHLANVAGSIVDAPDAVDGNAVALPTYGRLTGIPFPLTSHPLTLWVRVRAGTPEDVIGLNADIGGQSHLMASARPAAGRHWQWLPLQAEQPAVARGSVSLSLRQNRRGLPKAWIDTILLRSQGDPPDDRVMEIPSLTAQRPLIAMGRTDRVPVIDGRLDDPCWQEGVVVRDFVINTTGQPPSQTTEARLCHDDQAIYIAFRCREYVLQVEANQRHEFRQAQSEPDSEVWKDDSVVILLAPPGGEAVYDIFCNARGVIADARCTPPDIWSSRDPEWNGNIQAAAQIDNGLWTVEMAIPIESMTETPAEIGDRWRIGLGRIAKHAAETTSWHPVKRGFHEIDSLGYLRFAEQVAAVDLVIPAKLSSGRAAVACRHTGETSPVLAALHIDAPGSPAKTVSTLLTPGSHTDLPFTVSREGRMAITPTLLDAGSLAPLYLPPRQVRMAKASECRMRLRTDGPYRVFLNGTAVASGNSADGSTTVTVPLETGVNAFAVTTHTGRLAATLELPGATVVTDESWRMNPETSADFTRKDIDDSDWQRAAVLESADGRLGRDGASVIGTESPCVFRRTVLYEHTYVWPTPQPALFVPANATQHITVSTTGIPGRRLAGYELHLLTPPSLDIVGVTGYYGRTRPEKAQFSLREHPNSAGSAGPRRHMVVTADQPLPYRPKVRILELLNLFVEFRGEELPTDPLEVTYWTSAENGSVSECPQSFKVVVSPPLNGKQPASMTWQLWGSFFGPMDDPEMKRRTLQTAAKAGFNNIVAGTSEDTRIGEALGFSNTLGINFEPWSLGRTQYLETYPDAALIEADGAASAKYVCTTVLLGDGWNDVARKLGEKIESTQAQVVDWDYESSPFASYLTCYCPRCLDAFREHADLDDDAVLTPAGIRNQYAGQWIDFMTTRNAEVAERFKQVAHNHQAQFSMYSGYHSEETRRIYGVDWAKIGARRAADHVGCGYGRRPELVKATIQALDGIPLVLGVLMRPYDRSLREPAQPLTKARILRRQTDATGGVLVYDRLPLDGRGWFAAAEVSRLVADYEEVFLNGTDTADLVTVTPSPEPEVAIRHYENTVLVLLMNQGQKETQFTVSANAEPRGEAKTFFGDAQVDLAHPTTLTLAPGDAEAIVIRMTR